MPKLTFLGATQTVTGSKYLLEAAGERLMIDCGLFQGHKELRLRNWSPLPIEPSSIQWLVLTHAHLDHTGYIPRLVKEGFRGEIWASSATVDLAHLVLPDSGHLQEEDARYANKKGFSKHKPALPLYTQEEALQSLERFRVVDESGPLELSPHFKLKFFRAGHILGARMVEVTLTEEGKSVTVLFSGDLGRFPQLIIREPAVPGAADYLVCESTYGDRLHPTDDFRARLAQIVERTAERGGSVIIPSFAVGRTQELLYLFRMLINGNQMHDLPIHVDSPMAIDATDLYRKHHEDHNLQTDEFESGGHRLFAQPNVHFDRSVEESKALNECRYPTVIISASGMATGGRVLHHLIRCLPDHRNTVLFVGFQAPGTRGHIIQSGADSVKIHGQIVPIRAHVETIENLSAHADYREIMAWLEKFPSPPRKTFITHGELHAATALQEKITGELGWKAEVPSYLESFPLGV
ncbi:MAG TPA: MBL fold metallo-hydrolase [Terriglobia bacterium]|nr:MBL fold metallo-hydrolase [Terriglobia bacterium]